MERTPTDFEKLSPVKRKIAKKLLESKIAEVSNFLKTSQRDPAMDGVIADLKAQLEFDQSELKRLEAVLNSQLNP